MKLTQGKFPQNLPTSLQVKDRRRKQSQEPADSLYRIPSKLLQKRPRTSLENSAVEDTFGREVVNGASENKINPIDYWTRKGSWPKEYFKQDDRSRKDFEKDSWFEKYWEEKSNMSHLLARKKSSSSLRGKQSEPGSVTTSSTTPSDQKPREEKSADYKHVRYETLLATKGSFMGKYQEGITKVSKDLCQTLLETELAAPEDSLFRDDLFEETCEMVRNRNEAKVLQDITRLIVPSAGTLAIRGAKHLKILIESVNEGWNNSIPVTKTRPQPDYSVGFRREAFTEDQLKRIQPIVGELTDTSFFMATYYMYFPFLTCEVKCGAAAFDIADRQNAHSMTLAVRAIVELFKLVKREKEVDREILAFSISHDHRTVRIYGHYALIDGNKTTFYRHPIHTFDFTALDGREKWTAYKFTKNIYDIWIPTHFTKICSVIDELPPDLDFGLSQQSELQFLVQEKPGLSQDLEGRHLSQQSNADSLLGEDDSQSSLVGSQDTTPDTSLSERTEQGTFKVSKKRRTAE